MLTKTRAIVIGTVKYGERKMIVDLFTEVKGRLSFITTISSSPRSQHKRLYFQPLTLLHLEFDDRPGQNLLRMRDFQVERPYTTTQTEMEKTAICMFLAEFLNHATRGEQANRPLFDYIVQSLLWLDRRSERYANFHLVFMLRFSVFVGFFPNLDDYVEGDFFDLREGAFDSVAPLHSDYLWPEEAARLQRAMRMTYENMHLFRMSHAYRNWFTEMILKYYRLHIPGFPQLKSLEVLKSLFE
ncbi:DNA repair protein RecO [Prevotella sp. A2931]|uniref:DNA repair protein RecO n=1 Tax=Prevotella illustrans TaxID=2800387 RepID=A0ABS3M224_9BACT|nr:MULTISPECIES: DNA repair protein RecO [Prevotella]MBO1362189.1 DNA repair protein RecO [Prevotella illustrans]PTL26537.1 DNA repair protein RecO [Prevotella sp. oral taxon 820]